MGGQMAATAVGLIEYAQAGEGPTVLLCHGGPGGHDQSFMAAPLARNGFHVLTPSRPGYLGTPLSSGATIEQQADGMAALLDRLGIGKRPLSACRLVAPLPCNWRCATPAGMGGDPGSGRFPGVSTPPGKRRHPFGPAFSGPIGYVAHRHSDLAARLL
ncbi:MAG: alpha/beta hydrolase [Chloroflexi bacterium]|nr:alpha/beta hydrolase [Chloroflexota bacterium]